jgi:hypothetical protein
LVEDAQIVCEGALVTYAGPATDIRAADREVLVDGFVMPAVADRHVHIEMSQPASVLAGGVTAVRDLAWLKRHRRLAVRHEHCARTHDGVVVRAHSEGVGPRGRDGQEVSAAGLREGDTLDENVAGLAILPGDRDSRFLPTASIRQRCLVPSVIERWTNVVRHPAINADVAAYPRNILYAANAI